MLSQEQLQHLITENENLQAQVKELNLILSVREEELEYLKNNASEVAELRSRLDMQLDDFQSMQNEIGEKQQQMEAAAERELELQEELRDAAQLQQLYIELLQEYAWSQAQLNDIQAQLLELNKRNRLLQDIAGKIGELESNLADSAMERDELRSKIALLERSSNPQIIDNDHTT